MERMMKLMQACAVLQLMRLHASQGSWAGTAPLDSGGVAGSFFWEVDLFETSFGPLDLWLPIGLGQW